MLTQLSTGLLEVGVLDPRDGVLTKQHDPFPALNQSTGTLVEGGSTPKNRTRRPIRGDTWWNFNLTSAVDKPLEWNWMEWNGMV